MEPWIIWQNNCKSRPPSIGCRLTSRRHSHVDVNTAHPGEGDTLHGDFLDMIVDHLSDNPPSLYRLMRSSRAWYAATVGPLWAHGTVEDLESWDLEKPVYRQLEFPRLRSFAFIYSSLSGSGVERNQALQSLLQPTLTHFTS